MLTTAVGTTGNRLRRALPNHRIDSYFKWRKSCHLKTVILNDTQEEEDKHIRKVAEDAPLEELELFLDKPGRRDTEPARAVMRQVFQMRLKEIRRLEARAAARQEWWWGLLQQAWAQVTSGIIIGLVTGFAAAWFVFSP